MKNLLVVVTTLLLLGVGATAQAAGWNSDIDADIKRNDFNHIGVVAASHPEAQGDIALYLLQQAQVYKNTPDREVKIFKAATPYVGKISAVNAGIANDIIAATVKVGADQKFQQKNPREASDIFVSALQMSGQPNIAGYNPGLHAEVLDAADDFVKSHPQDVDKRLLEMTSSLAVTPGAQGAAPVGVVNPNGAAGGGVTNASISNAGVNKALNEAIKYDNFNQVNIIAASHPEAQGDIAIYLLQQSQTYKSNPDHEVRLFKSATPFVGRIPAGGAGTANDIIDATVRIAADPTFQQKNPRDAADIFLSALLMSGQPNIVAYNPNLHAEVLEAANDFIKAHPQDADKRLTEEVSLAQAGGAPEATPKGVVNPSAE